MSAVVHYERMIELMLAAPAKIGGMLFKDGKSDVIDGQDNADAEYGFAEYDKHHQASIPFARF